LIPGDFDLANSGSVSVTLKDEDGAQGTLEDNNDPTIDHADITVTEEGTLHIRVIDAPIID
jgi:mannitol-1-phosphate/altronate dehydrogenase